MHEEIFLRPRLSVLCKNIYIPKFRAKSFAPYLYAGETESTYNDYKTFSNKTHLFGNSERSREELVLGIHSSFDDSSASLVNSFGEIKHITSIDQQQQWDSNMGINPSRAMELHSDNLPFAIEKVISDGNIV